ncbi:MAG: alpha/beta hydrolase [Thermodesulfobacteriota bacterium]|nr:alpha/beta hydrolase [Thermodesulfobacteriota bacterium]
MVKSGDDLSVLDLPEILQFVFFPRKDFGGKPSMEGVTDYRIPVEDEVFIGCRSHICGKDFPNILYFHGNGEIVSDYDDVAPLFKGIGANLLVADYRGYGFSSGTPTLSSMIEDAHNIFHFFVNILREEGYTGKLFVMGRSLGSASALELACNYQEQISGVIIESGFANLFDLLRNIGFPVDSLNLSDEIKNSTLSKIRSINIPVLIIHAQYDNIIPLTEGMTIFENVPTDRKRMLVVPNADHNNIMIMGLNKYFGVIEQFVFQ